ncbi:uncharacterized protein LOC119692795 isoform X1 [Plutella xylostella]|uniref:uncharacterized protein LOC119692795 isoform X1 n=1 Tax=Plutella xylostella TaxID=51655 RepID=UPI00203270AB|nr:uncharacterized protein LOC119692795 isoform X1 [Plutella xylostella]
MLNRIKHTLIDDSKVLLGPNVALLRLAGLYLPAGRGARTACLLLHALGTAFIVLQYVELYFISDDLHLVVLTLKINMASTNVVMKAFCYLVFQRRWRELHDYVTAADEAERARPAAAAAVRRYTALSRRVTAAFCMFSVFTGFVLVFGPYIKWLSERYLDRVPAELMGPVDHIFQAYVPFDKYSPRGRLIANIWFAMGALYGCAVFTAFDVAAVVVMVFLGCKLQLLAARCERLFAPAPGGDRFWETVREVHTEHVMLIKYSKIFNSLISPVMFLYTLLCSLMLCTTAFQITSMPMNITEKILTVEYLVFGVSQVFMYSWISNDVLCKSQLAMQGVYHSAWTDGLGAGARAGARRREAAARGQALRLLAGQLAAPICFTTGPFADLTLANFVNILKGAYSYYTLLKD